MGKNLGLLKLFISVDSRISKAMVEKYVLDVGYPRFSTNLI